MKRGAVLQLKYK